MPIYEYICEDCQNEFEKIVINKHEEITCPKCAGKKNKIQLSVLPRLAATADRPKARPFRAAEAVAAAAVAAATSLNAA